MIRAAAAIVATALVAFVVVSQVGAQATITIGIDADPADNAADSLGEIQDCRRVAQGDTFDIDVFVRDVPESPSGTIPPTLGLSGFSFDILYDPAVIKINSADAEQLLTRDDPDNELFFLSGTEPDSDGDYRVDVAQLPTSGAPLFESGDGVLLRLTVEAVGAGITALALNDVDGGDGVPDVYDAGAIIYSLDDVQDAAIAVGQACAAPPPLPAEIAAKAPAPPPATASDDGTGDTGDTTGDEPGETPAGEPGETPAGEPGETATGEPGETPAGEPGEPGAGSTPAPGETPTGDGAATGGPTGSEGTALAMDVIPTGNTATSLGSVEPCASAQEGDTFEIDLVIRDVADLLAWEIGISYDPAVLEVQDRDVQMFQAANAGSSVLDTSGETPDTSGRYVVQAVDTSDPPTPDSGSGVLARITFKAIGEGTSRLSVEKIDLNDDGTPDQGPFLRAHSLDIIGDEDGDTFFDGPIANAEIYVGEPCPGAQEAEGNVEGPTVRTVDDDGGIGVGIIVGAVAAGIAALIAAGGLGALLIRRRRQASTGQ